MGKSSTDTCCLTLPLQLEKWQEDRLAKRFELARQIYNTLVQDYPQFVQLHDQTIQRLSRMPKTLASMGIRRSIS